jgi:5-methylcytosine-specific restriction enzyme A
MRKAPEWIGRTADTAIPPRVRVRVFERHDGKCYLTGVKIMPGDKWEIEHVIALCNGGEHRESNLAPALKNAHKIKTCKDMGIKKKIARVRKKHLNVHKPRGRPLPGTKRSGWRKPFYGDAERRD